MDESAADDILDAVDASTLSGSDAADVASDKNNTPIPGKPRWRSLSALKAQASMQDKLLEKLIQQVMPRPTSRLEYQLSIAYLS